MNFALFFLIIAMVGIGMLLAYFSSNQSKAKTVEKPIRNLGALRKKVYHLVSEAETKEAIQALVEAGLPGAGDLQEHHKKVTRELFMGLVPFEQFARSIAQCNAAIIDMLPTKPTRVTAVREEEIITLTEQDQLEEALQILMQTAPEQASLHLSQLNLLKKFIDQKLTLPAPLNLTRKRVQQAILSYLNKGNY